MVGKVGVDVDVDADCVCGVCGVKCVWCRS